MKTFVYVVAGTTIVMVALLAGLVIWIMNKGIQSNNKMRTEAARAARWAVDKNGKMKEDEPKTEIENEKI